MALNFNANQYEKAFKPNKLCNWEVSKNLSVLPKRRTGATKIIVNDRGHLLPGIRKLNPWTENCTTPHPVTVSTNHSEPSENKMGHSDDILTSWEKRSSHVPVVPHETLAIEAFPCVAVNSRRSSIDRENESHKSLSLTQQEPHSNISSSRSQASNKSPRLSIIERENEDKCNDPLPLSRSVSQTSIPILAKAYSNDIIARHLKLHNQKHQSLADAVDVSARTGISKSQWLDAEAKIDTWIPAVGCKLYQSPGPTQCSKLKVFRPKTTVPIKNHEIERRDEGIHCEKRPKTAPRSKHLSEMDLAIYWDVSMPSSTHSRVSCRTHEAFSSPVPLEERKIDDTVSIPEKAPSVKEIADETSEKEPEKLKSPSPNLENPVSATPERKYSTPNSSAHRQRKKDIRKSITDLPQATSDCPKPPSEIRSTKLYASAPNLVNIGVQVNPVNFRTTARICEACNVPPSTDKEPKIVTESYKLAFKAGKPNTLTIDDRTMERLHKARHLHVPKPKIPYSKKSYSIGTLMPPFSVWPRAVGQDYPDHWRLASVYQHSYKPLETRKVPLMRTVFQ